MAALAGGIALAEVVGPAVINLIAGLVHKKAPVIEAARGPQTGPVKFADLFGEVITSLQSAAAVGSIPKALPDDGTIKVIMQAVVTSMKLLGLLDGPAPVPAAVATAPGAQALVLKAGQSVTITVQ